MQQSETKNTLKSLKGILNSLQPHAIQMTFFLKMNSENSTWVNYKSPKIMLKYSNQEKILKD